MRRATVLLIFAAIGAMALAGCRSMPVNSNPSCDPCTRYLPDGGIPPACRDLAAEVESLTELEAGRRYENLVFEGGGVKGVAYAGVLQVLDRNELLAPVERVAGTSAGAITALLISLGYEAEEMCSIIFNMDFRDFNDASRSTLSNLNRLRWRYGWYRGDFALCMLRCLVEKKTGSKDTTFAQLHQRATQDNSPFRELFVVGTDLNLHQVRVFSYQTTPDVALADAVRISMSIPLYFGARELDGQIFVDGGVLWNYPIQIFDETTDPETTLGFNLGTIAMPAEIRDLEQYLENLATTFFDAQVEELCRTKTDIRRSAFINPLGISTTDFDLTTEQKRALMAEGRKGTEQFLAHPGERDSCPQWLNKLLAARRPGAI